METTLVVISGHLQPSMSGGQGSYGVRKDRTCGEARRLLGVLIRHLSTT